MIEEKDPICSRVSAFMHSALLTPSLPKLIELNTIKPIRQNSISRFHESISHLLDYSRAHPILLLAFSLYPLPPSFRLFEG